MAPILTYPPELTDKVWQKKKGVIGKATKTGVGETLLAMEKAFADRNYQHALDPVGAIAKVKDPLGMQKSGTLVQKVLTDQGKKLEAAAKNAEKAIFLAKGKLAKDKAVVAHLDLMATSLTRFRRDVAAAPAKGSSELVSAFTANFAKTKIYAYVNSGIAGKTEKARLEVMARVKNIESAGTIATIATHFKGDGPHRLLTTNCKMWDQLFIPEAPQLMASLHNGQTLDDFGRKPWMWEVANETQNDATDAVTALADRTSVARAVNQFCLEYSRSLIEYQRFTAALAKLEKVVKKYS